LFNFLTNISSLARQLFPTGRAFKMAENSYLESLMYALSLSENRAYNDALSIQNSILPDNSEFTSDDATDWERRLGMIVNPLVDLELRKLAIRRKINHPGNIKARQHYLYIEGQLRAAGFDVYVYENRFPYGGSYYTRSLFDIIGGVGIDALQYGDSQYGDSQYGGTYSNIIANYIDEIIDSNFAISSNLRCTFFIGANPLGQFANVPIERKQEFRQLILKLKPTQMVGYLLINYI
jgi:hypothetical protein